MFELLRLLSSGGGEEPREAVCLVSGWVSAAWCPVWEKNGEENNPSSFQTAAWRFHLPFKVDFYWWMGTLACSPSPPAADLLSHGRTEMVTALETEKQLFLNLRDGCSGSDFFHNARCWVDTTFQKITDKTRKDAVRGQNAVLFQVLMRISLSFCSFFT